MYKKIISVGLTIAGFAAIGFFVNKLGLQNLLNAFKQMGWGILVIILIPIYLYVMHAIAWSFTLSKENRKKIGLFRLIVLQTFSYGIAGIQPFQGMVSEPLKLVFLKDKQYDKIDFTSSLLLNNTMNGFSIITVFILGLIYMMFLPMTSLFVKILIISSILLIVFILYLVIFIQKKGVFSGILLLIGRIPLFRKFKDKHIQKTRDIDDRVKWFYEKNRKCLYLSYLFHVLEKIHGVFEFFFIFYFLNMPVTIMTSFLIFFIINILDNVLFFIQIGGMEVYISTLLHLLKMTKDSINITVALFRRVRILFWGILALLLIYPMKRLFTKKQKMDKKSA